MTYVKAPPEPRDLSHILILACRSKNGDPCIAADRAQHLRSIDVASTSAAPPALHEPMITRMRCGPARASMSRSIVALSPVCKMHGCENPTSCGRRYHSLLMISPCPALYDDPLEFPALVANKPDALIWACSIARLVISIRANPMLCRTEGRKINCGVTLGTKSKTKINRRSNRLRLVRLVNLNKSVHQAPQCS